MTQAGLAFVPIHGLRVLSVAVQKQAGAISLANRKEKKMEKTALSKYVRISPSKAREVARLIQGKPALLAMTTVKLIPRKAARLIEQTLKSAIANAENDANNRVDSSRLYVKEAIINEGSTLKRFIPKARGSAGRIRKRSSHIRIVVSDRA